ILIFQNGNISKSPGMFYSTASETIRLTRACTIRFNQVKIIYRTNSRVNHRNEVAFIQRYKFKELRNLNSICTPQPGITSLETPRWNKFVAACNRGFYRIYILNDGA